MKDRTTSRASSAIFAALLLSIRGLRATDAPEVEADADEADKPAKQLANPNSSLISVPFQANEDFGYGPSHNGYKFTLNIQPVIPISISKDWNLILRTILPVVSQHDLVREKLEPFSQTSSSESNARMGEGRKKGCTVESESTGANETTEAPCGSSGLRYFKLPANSAHRPFLDLSR